MGIKAGHPYQGRSADPDKGGKWLAAEAGEPEIKPDYIGLDFADCAEQRMDFADC